MRHEQGPRFRSAAERIAILVHWSDGPRVSQSAQTLLTEFATAGYETAFVSAATCPEPLTFSQRGLLDAVSVYRRPNIGYDFGSWASFLHAFPAVRHSPRVILANDSLLGPFETIRPLLDAFDSCPTDIWGITGTTQDTAHLQSHMVGYRDGVLAEPALRRFWGNVRVEPTKRDLILRYEIGLSRLAYAEGYVLAAHFPWNWSTSLGQNPTSAGWRRLMMLGFPFVKRELVLRPPPEVPDVADVPQVVKQRWGENVFEWI
jgi:lipopolysaccharide biosynthesis protein